MRRVSIALLISVFAMYGSATHAVDFPNGLYWGANAGVSEDIDICDSQSTPQGFGTPTNCQDSDFGWQAFLGYQVMKWISVEAGYADLGGSDVRVVNDTISSNIDGFTLSVAVTAPVLEKIGLYGIGGAFLWDADVTEAGLNMDTVTNSDSGTDYFYGLSLRLPLSKTIGMNLEAKRFKDIGSSDIGTTNVNLWTAGLLFRF